MITHDELRKMMDEEELLKMGRYAGGHDEQMQGLIKGAKVIAHWNEGDYQGAVATCIQIPSGEYVIYNDYYGSCSGCDAWEDATDEAILSMCNNLVYDSLIFGSLQEVKEFLAKADFRKYSWGEASKYLLEEIKKQENKNELE